MENTERPKTGVGVMIFKDGKILLARRRGSHGAGEYAFPGGHLEYMESFEDCARRETREECGIEIENIRFQLLANVTHYAPRHDIYISVAADWKSGEPSVLEPNKSESWGWYDTDHLPEPMFAFCTLSIQSHKTGQSYFDIPDIRS